MGRGKQGTIADHERDRLARNEDDLRQIILEALENYEEPYGRDDDAAQGIGWQSPLWEVARTVKGSLRNNHFDGIESWKLVRRLVPVNRFVEADSRLENEEDAVAAWASAWDKIRYLPGETLLDSALREGDANPVAPPCDRSIGYARFLSLCAALARVRGEIISIGEERWGRLLGVRPNTVSTWREWAVQDGVLQLTRSHSHSARRATEFRVVLEKLFPVRGTL